MARRTTETTERPTLLTDPDQLRTAADDLRRQAHRLDEVRSAIARELTPESFTGQWEGRVAEGFLRHVNGRYRQDHLDVAHDRLIRLVRSLGQAADANEEQIVKNRRLSAEVEAELARRGDQPGSETLPQSMRDTRWPRVHRMVVGGAR